MKDYLEIYEGDRYCLMCRHVCPVGRLTKRESTTPHGWALLIHSANHGFIPWNEETIDVLYQCCDCGLCQADCATHRPLPAAIVAARAQVVRSGKAPASVLDVDRALRAHGHPFEKSAGGAKETSPGRKPQVGARTTVEAPEGRKNAIGFFIGTTPFIHAPSLAAAEALLQKHNPVALGAGRSSGYLAYTLGLWDTARQLAQQTIDEIRDNGITRIITLTREDAHTFKNVYPEIEIPWPTDVEIVELIELLAQDLKAKKLKWTNENLGKFTYHDPCHTSRLPETSKTTRELIAALTGQKPIEMLWREKLATPCGAVGGLEITHPELAAEMAQSRLTEAKQAGADTIITEDPNCAAHLSKHASGIRVMSLLESVKSV